MADQIIAFRGRQADDNRILDDCIGDLRDANRSLFVIQTALTSQGCDADNNCAALIDDYTWKKIESVIERLKELKGGAA